MSEKVTTMPAAEPRSSITPEGTIMLPDGEYTIRIDFNALAEVEEITGKNMMDASAFQSLSAKGIRTILWVFIKQRHPEVTIEKVGANLSMGNMAYVLQTITKVWLKAMPKKEDTDQPKEGEAKVPLQ